jgi:orotidine-5'-phosphate decarboxylase
MTSKPSIPTHDRLIVALDVPTAEEARGLVERLGNSVSFYKVGLELLMSGGYWELVQWLRDQGKRVFVDLKFFDVPNTVASAVRCLAGRGVDFATVHGNDAILRAACEARDVSDGPRILGVTVLTSLDRADMDDLGFQTDIKALVLSRARRALEIGCDGVISSGLEAPALRDATTDGFLIVVPGIRPGSNRASDDQKRTVDVEDAFERGADHIVVGRPIHGAEDPHAAATAIQQRIARHFTP